MCGAVNRQRPARSASTTSICATRGGACAGLLGFGSKVARSGLRAPPQPSRAIEPVASREPAAQSTLLTPTWEATRPAWDAEGLPAGARVLVVGADPEQFADVKTRCEGALLWSAAADDSIETLIERLGSETTIDQVIWLAPSQRVDGVADDHLISGRRPGVLGAFRLIKALLQLGYGMRELGWTVVTWDTLRVLDTDDFDPTHASVHGLMGSLGREYPNWRIRTADLPRGGAWPCDELLRLPTAAGARSWAYRSHEWFQQRLLETRLLEAHRQFREGGVYVVIGGAGGLGEVLSEYLIRNYRARMVWIGRRPCDASIQAKIDRLARLGSAPVYLSRMPRYRRRCSTRRSRRDRGKLME